MLSIIKAAMLEFMTQYCKSSIRNVLRQNVLLRKFCFLTNDRKCSAFRWSNFLLRWWLFTPNATRSFPTSDPLLTSSVASPKLWEGPKNLVRTKMLDFRQITPFCFGYRLLKHTMAICSENLGWHGP